jgi:hypothetical protein
LNIGERFRRIRQRNKLHHLRMTGIELQFLVLSTKLRKFSKVLLTRRIKRKCNQVVKARSLPRFGLCHQENDWRP